MNGASFVHYGTICSTFSWWCLTHFDVRHFFLCWTRCCALILLQVSPYGHRGTTRSPMITIFWPISIGLLMTLLDEFQAPWTCFFNTTSPPTPKNPFKDEGLCSLGHADFHFTVPVFNYCNLISFFHKHFCVCSFSCFSPLIKGLWAFYQNPNLPKRTYFFCE